jgi:hypothetical protein
MACASYLSHSSDTQTACALNRWHASRNGCINLFALAGMLRVDNKFSKTSKGEKSFLLKFVEPPLKKRNAGEIVPINIGGTFSHPSYGLGLAL